MNKVTLAIILLNWNNPDDTLDCLESLLVASEKLNSCLFVADNGSTDQSLRKIRSTLEYKAVAYSFYQRKKDHFVPVIPHGKERICLLDNGENLGFAQGNNVVLKFALHEHSQHFTHYLLLNNDTVVPPDALVNLTDMASGHPEFKIWTPLITYAHNPEIIWNAGGFLGRWGGRKYLGHKKSRDTLPQKGFRQITFVTGCAMMLHHELPEQGYFLNEDFFFGEEDYYFSMQMKKTGIKIAVCFASEIRHKVGTSVQKVSSRSQLALYYIHYLNRIIDMKNWMAGPVYAVWKSGFLFYAAFDAWWKSWYSPADMLKFIYLLYKNTKKKQQVTRDDFFGAKELFK